MEINRNVLLIRKYGFVHLKLTRLVSCEHSFRDFADTWPSFLRFWLKLNGTYDKTFPSESFFCVMSDFFCHFTLNQGWVCKSCDSGCVISFGLSSWYQPSMLAWSQLARFFMLFWNCLELLSLLDDCFCDEFLLKGLLVKQCWLNA